MMPADETATSVAAVPTADHPRALRAAIETTRADLGGTMSTLTGKVDPGARLRHAGAAAQARVAQAGAALRKNPLPVAAALATATAAVAATFAYRRRGVRARARRGWLPRFLKR
jgi:hypothetical protein